jgi:hypothetical protein
MSDIQVCLTTSSYILAGKNIPENFEKYGIPVCTAEIGLGMFGYTGSEKEREEFVFGQICKKMAKEVFVDIEKRWVFVGEDHKDPETGLIDYTEQKYVQCVLDFFINWTKYHVLLMEFSVSNPLQGRKSDLTKIDPIAGSGTSNFVPPKDTTLFCLRGFWEVDHWNSLDVFPSANIKIVS